jgi:hypothetical protein
MARAAGKPTARKNEVIILEPSTPFPIKGNRAHAARFSVRAGGKIAGHDAPALLRVHKNDLVVWLCSNLSKESIKVWITDFVLKKTKKAITPVSYLSEEQVVVPAGATRPIFGRINRKPSHIILPEKVKYTIHLEGRSFGVIDYDPDMEIMP